MCAALRGTAGAGAAVWAGAERAAPCVPHSGRALPRGARAARHDRVYRRRNAFPTCTGHGAVPLYAHGHLLAGAVPAAPRGGLIGTGAGPARDGSAFGHGAHRRGQHMVASAPARCSLPVLSAGDARGARVCVCVHARGIRGTRARAACARRAPLSLCAALRSAALECARRPGPGVLAPGL